MHTQNPRLTGFSLGALFLLLAGLLVATPASAAAVDISFTLKDDPTCRQWQEGQTAEWNFTLAMNGTDTSLIATPTYVWVDDTGAPALRADSWVAILTASGDTFSSPASYDTSNSNTFATGSGVYTPGPGSLDIYLYSGSHTPTPAPVTNVTVLITPSATSENKDHYFNITARTHRMGTTDITRKVTVCIHIPPKPRFDMGNFTDSLQAAADSNITVSFWLKNTGNTQDYYFCNVTVPREDWTWNFTQGVTQVGPPTNSQNITNFLNISQNITIRVKVYVPINARARENSTVSVNCSSYKALTLGINLFVYPPYTRVEVIQYYYIAARVPVGEPSLLAGVPGDKLTFNFLVSNFGNGPDQGTARVVQGNNSWDYVVTPNDFDLPAKDDVGFEQPAQFIVTIPNGTLIFTYNFQVNVTSVVNNTPVTALTFRVQVLQTYVPLISPVDPKNGQPAQEVVFNFTIKNGGNGLDNLIIEVFNMSEWKVFLSPPIGKKLLEVNQEAQFQATVIVPKELVKAQVGIYNQTVRVSSEYAQTDHGELIYQEVNLSVIILPRIACSLDPPDTEKELNPFAFPGGVATANFLLTISNTGNGGDADTVSAVGPAGFNITLAPGHLQLNILETKAILVTIEAPADVASGDYYINVTGRSDYAAAATCAAVYHLQVYHLDGAVNPSISSYIQNPDHPTDDITTSVSVAEVTQVEGYFVKFRVTIENKGDRAIEALSAKVVAYDILTCDHPPVGAKVDTCGTRQVFNWTNQQNIIRGVGGSTYFEYFYFSPEYLCFDTDVCHRTDPPPPANAHHVRFVLTIDHEAETSNNQAEVVVLVLPAAILQKAPAAAPFPVLPVGAGVGIAGAVGFAYWYRFVRKPKVDEDLYASIYGAEGAPGATSQSVDQYFQTQQGGGQGPPPVPKAYQGMTDEQLEEARRIYGENYGR